MFTFLRLNEPTKIHKRVKLRQNLTSSFQVIVNILVDKYDNGQMFPEFDYVQGVHRKTSLNIQNCTQIYSRIKSRRSKTAKMKICDCTS